MQTYINQTEAHEDDQVLFTAPTGTILTGVLHHICGDGTASVTATVNRRPYEYKVNVVEVWLASDALKVAEYQRSMMSELTSAVEEMPPAPKVPVSITGEAGLAEVIYTEYCRAVGGKAFNGDTLPSWAEFSKDPAKEKQAAAWVLAAMAAVAWYTNDRATTSTTPQAESVETCPETVAPPVDNLHVAPGCQPFSSDTVNEVPTNDPVAADGTADVASDVVPSPVFKDTVNEGDLSKDSEPPVTEP